MMTYDKKSVWQKARFGKGMALGRQATSQYEIAISINIFQEIRTVSQEF